MGKEWHLQQEQECPAGCTHANESIARRDVIVSGRMLENFSLGYGISHCLGFIQGNLRTPGHARISMSSFLWWADANDLLNAVIRGTNGCMHCGLCMLGSNVQFEKSAFPTDWHRNVPDGLPGWRGGGCLQSRARLWFQFCSLPNCLFWLTGQQEMWKAKQPLSWECRRGERKGNVEGYPVAKWKSAPAFNVLFNVCDSLTFGVKNIEINYVEIN